MEVEKVIRRTVIDIGQNATVEITEPFMNQMKYICSEINYVEWSGYVFFSTKGSPKDLEKFKIIPYYIHPMDKGTSGATEFDDDGSLLDLYEQMPELDPFNDTKYRYGKIHSHNSMDVFHSATDMQDLQDQSGHYEYYFSLIVNNRMELEAKASFVAEIPAQLIKPNKFRGAKDWRLSKEEVLGVIDFEFELEDSIVSIPRHFQDRVVEIKKPKVYVPTHVIPTNSNFGLGSHHDTLAEFYEEMEAEAEMEEEQDIADSVMVNIELRRYLIGKALVTKWLADRLRIVNSAPTVLLHVKGLSFVIINQMEVSITNWFDKLTPPEKENIVFYLNKISSIETHDKYDTILEFIWEHVKTEDIIEGN